ncbi:MAG: Tol-Pal system beta propeller repeat protein TolB [Nitrospirae bacterium]|nr:Tol-Pal system beta propeller repeat protein TolB [Nitrospirota bacterium]
MNIPEMAKVRKKSNNLMRVILLFLISASLSASICALSALSALLCPSVCEARVYLDITSPGIKKFPIAIQDFTGKEALVQEGLEISDIIRSDLQFTDLFFLLDKNAFIETSDSPFNADNWKPLGADLVVKGTIEISPDGSLGVVVSAYDVVEMRNILKKKYSSKKDLVRPLAHKIADDLFEVITGKRGLFGTRIVFVGQDGQNRSIYLMDFDGQRLKKIVGRGSLTMKPRWSGDGKKIAYSSLRNGKWSIYILDFDTATERLIYSSGATDLAGDFTPDGKYLLFSSSGKGSPDIYLLHLGTKVISRLTYEPAIEVSPSVSPDGKQIVYVSDRSSTPQLYVMGIDGNDSRRITFEGNYNTAPEWSLAGDLIVFTSRAGGSFQVCTIKSDGSGMTQLTSAGNNDEPSFSSDGRYIIFTSDRDGVKGVYQMNVNGEQQHRISPRNIRAFGPSWSR